MTYYDLMVSANRKLDNNEITLGEYEKMIEPLKREIEPERKTGHWIIHSDDLFPSESTQECSECHEHQPLDWRHSDNYCPNCGADMREVQDE